MLIGYSNKSVIVTYIGVGFAILGMNYSFNGNIPLAVMFMIFAGICDLFDGKYARMFKRTDEEKEFGVQIDSLADMVSFVAFPVVLAFSIGLNSWYNIVICVLYVLAGITRLGYFNVQASRDLDNPVKFYKGLPVTYAALIFPVVWMISQYIDQNFFERMYTLIMFVVSMLFVVNIKIPKPKGIAYMFFVCIAIGMSVFIIFRGV